MILPSKAMTMNTAFRALLSLVIVVMKDGISTIDMVGSLCPLEVNVAKIGIVGRVLVVTIFTIDIACFGTVSIVGVIFGMAILNPVVVTVSKTKGVRAR